ncbi:hypothetical protein A3L09_01380 [Thermococcus profundus]|uniref:Uncharacterized protein n=1 Tax=Thermococcus profundus TaxID=49899 RepID=A0A2Z2MJ81_THEPR|nr:hypothetical protein [Thermococcus profundus]ASJ02008.1 hypothetical protein A3L09_01380 [Thermococcus profundus]
MRIFKVPREPGAGGTIILSMVGGLILAHADWRGWLIGLIVAMVTFFTFDFAFDSYRAWNLKGMIAALGINGLAYILPAFYWFGSRIFEPSTDNPPFVPLTVVGILFALHFAFSRAKGWKHPVTYALGNLLPAVPALFAPAVSGRPFNDDVFAFWLLLAYYEAIGAAYVETRLAFRKFPKKYPLMAWLPIFGVLAYNPYLIIALIEPTVRLVKNLREENYVAKIEDIKALGWSVFRSVMLLYVLTLAVLYLT